MTARDDAVRAAAEAAHDAYERRAAEVGWETQTRSRVPWVDVPEANKQAMYAAMDAAAPHLTADLIRERDEARAVASELIDKLSAEHVRANEAAHLSADARDEAADHERRWLDHQDVCVAASLDREQLEARAERAEAERDEARAEVERLRAKQTEMNGRLTKAEAHVETTIEDCRRQGVSIGRGLANAGYSLMRARAERAEAAVARIAAAIDGAHHIARAQPRADGGYRDGYCDGLEHAMRIAEGGTDD